MADNLPTSPPHADPITLLIGALVGAVPSVIAWISNWRKNNADARKAELANDMTALQMCQGMLSDMRNELGRLRDHNTQLETTNDRLNRDLDVVNNLNIKLRRRLADADRRQGRAVARTPGVEDVALDLEVVSPTDRVDLLEDGRSPGDPSS